MEAKIKRAKELIKAAIEKYPKTAVACSFGKDSIVTVHLAQQVKKDIQVFSVMTKFKPKETLEYLVKMNKEMDMALKVFLVSDRIPDIFNGNGLDIELLSPEEFFEKARKAREKMGQEIYCMDPDECCRMLKVEPTKEAVKHLDCWICGLRNTEGRTRKDYQEIERRGNLVKVNPILGWTEADVWRYMALNNLPVHPLYAKGYRSLGCAPCSSPGGEFERDGRWKGTRKCGGECGIHTQRLK
jgi:phosphoadenosine phosphosulfate reductase